MSTRQTQTSLKEGQDCISPICNESTHYFKEQALLLSEIEATSVTEDRKFGINRLGNSSRALLITKQQTNPADVGKAEYLFVSAANITHYKFPCKQTP